MIIDGKPVETLWRVRGVSLDDGNRKMWAIMTPTGLDTTIDFDNRILQPDKGLTLAFVQDLDGDRLTAALEARAGSSDNNPNTDGDLLTDTEEYYGSFAKPVNGELEVQRWAVEVEGKQPYYVRSSPARADTDNDGVSDYDEIQNTEVIYPPGFPGSIEIPHPIDPSQPDTDKDGVTDGEEINGYNIKLRFTPENVPSRTFKSLPWKADTDGDTLTDGVERDVGTDPNVDDGDKVLDSDGDGLVNFVEQDGYDVTYVKLEPKSPGSTEFVRNPYAAHVTTSINNADSDGDGLSDYEEAKLKTLPSPNIYDNSTGALIPATSMSPADSDGDGLKDKEEVTAGVGRPGRQTFELLYNPLDTDLDRDSRSDYAEVKVPWTIRPYGQPAYKVFSSPFVSDGDDDGLKDTDEMKLQTDPNKFDTDGDNPSIGDARELELSTNPLVPDQRILIWRQFDRRALGRRPVERRFENHRRGQNHLPGY